MTAVWRASSASFCEPASCWLPPLSRAGGVSYLVQHHSSQVNYHTFAAGGQSVRTLPGIVASAARLDSAGLIQFGLLLLIATPVARVAMALVGFALERDRLYTVVSLIVLLILALSLIRAT